MPENKSAEPSADAAEVPAEPGPATAEQVEPEIVERLEAIQSKLSEHQEQALRARAETENVRRRTQRELELARRYGSEGLARELLPVKDSLELAVDVELSHDNREALEKMLEGIELTVKLLSNAFACGSISELNPAPGERFDPELHQAISTVESEEVAAQCVVSVVQKGYRLHDRLLRPAMVIVARAPEGPAPGGQ